MKTRINSGIIHAVFVLAGLIALLGAISPRAATQTAAPLRLSIIAFMEAADIIKARGGAPVALSEVMNQKASSAKVGSKGGER